MSNTARTATVPRTVPRKKSERTKVLSAVSIIALVIYACVLFGMQLVRIGDVAFWSDEAFSIKLSRLDVPGMISATASDVHPPLYYLWLKLLVCIFGEHFFVYNLSALIPFGISLVFTLTFIRRTFGNLASALFMTCISLMPYAFAYNMEARMYTLAALFLLVCFYLVFRLIVRPSWGNWMLLALASVGAAYSHYYAMLAAAMLYLGLLVLMISRRRGITRWLASAALAVLLYVPWLSVLLTTFSRTASDWWSQSIPSVKDCLVPLLGNMWVIAVAIFVVMVLDFLKVSGLVRIEALGSSHASSNSVRRLRLGRIERPLDSILIWALIGMLGVFGTMLVGIGVSYIIRPLFLVRFMFPAMYIFWLVFSVAVSRLWAPKAATAILMALLILNGVSNYIVQLDGEKALAGETSRILESVSPEQGDGFISNNVHLSSMIGAYYPEGSRKLAEDHAQLLQSIEAIEVPTWVFSVYEIPAQDIDMLASKGVDLRYVANGAFGEKEIPEVFIYRAERLGDAGDGMPEP